eukprot:6563479-Pyramimonas_sp.AAC.1
MRLTADFLPPWQCCLVLLLISPHFALLACRCHFGPGALWPRRRRRGCARSGRIGACRPALRQPRARRFHIRIRAKRPTAGLRHIAGASHSPRQWPPASGLVRQMCTRFRAHGSKEALADAAEAHAPPALPGRELPRAIAQLGRSVQRRR